MLEPHLAVNCKTNHDHLQNWTALRPIINNQSEMAWVSKIL